MIYLRSLLIALLCVSTTLGVGYENAARINASGYQVFGVDLPATFVSTAGYTHNKATWPGTVWDFSGCPLAITQSGETVSRFTGALITPRHLLCAYHAVIPSGTVYFVTPAGSVISRTVSASSSLIGGDIRILTLDSAATGCAVYKLPTAGSIDAIQGATIWCLDLPRTVVTRRVSSIDAYIETTTDASGGTIISGDSGQPAFITRGTELVLLGTHHHPDDCPNAANYLAAIQSFCDATSQTVSTVSVDPASWAEKLPPVGLP